MTSLFQKEHHVAYCGGHSCPVCHKCTDWYYSPQNHNYCETTHRVYHDHLGPLVGPLYRWHRRPNATCGYHAYPHYVYYAAYHGDCPYTRCPPDSDPPHTHFYPGAAIHGLQLCHCKID
jgi:hypothetical protein